MDSKSGFKERPCFEGVRTNVRTNMGKVRRVKFSNGDVINYTYDAAGAKLKMSVTKGGTTTTTDYVGGFEYTGGALSYFTSPEGRTVKNGNNYEYEYFITDHKGNTRAVVSSVTPAASVTKATFGGDPGDQSSSFANVNAAHVFSFPSANNTAGGSQVVRMNQTYASGPSKSIKVYPGDKVDAEVYTYYEDDSGYGTGTPGVAAMVTAIAGGFGGVSGGGGESGSIYNGVNSAMSGFGLGGNVGDGAPAAYLNYILFDQQYKVLTAGWVRVPTSARFSKQKINLDQVNVNEAGFIFVYLSYENASNNYVYFDDFKVTHTKSNIVQSNEYYPFGQLAAGSWTRENAADNRYLANGGTELNRTSSLYDLEYRNYDPVLGRLYQVDPMAAKYASVTPYNYSFNNAVNLTDPSGADPYNHSPGTWFGGGHYTYDDVMPNRGSDGWSQATGRAGMTGGDGWMGYGSSMMNGGMGAYWHPGDGRLFWSGYELGAREYRYDQDRVRYGDMTEYQFYSKYDHSTPLSGFFISPGGTWTGFAMHGKLFAHRYLPSSPSVDPPSDVLLDPQEKRKGPGPDFYYKAIDGMTLNDGTTIKSTDVFLTFHDKVYNNEGDLVDAGNATYIGFVNGKHLLNFNIQDYEVTVGNIRNVANHEIYSHGKKGWNQPSNHYLGYYSNIDSPYWTDTTHDFKVHTAQALWLTWTSAGNFFGMPSKYMDVVNQYHPR